MCRCHARRSRSSVSRALDSVWWEHMSRLQMFGVRVATAALDVYEPPGGYGYGWWQAVARWSQWGAVRAQLCAYCVLKHPTLNSDIEQELRERRVEDRPTQQTLLSADSILVNPSIRMVLTKFIKKMAGDWVMKSYVRSYSVEIGS